MVLIWACARVGILAPYGWESGSKSKELLVTLRWGATEFALNADGTHQAVAKQKAQHQVLTKAIKADRYQP